MAASASRWNRGGSLLGTTALAAILLLVAPESHATHFATASADAGGAPQSNSGFFFAHATDASSSSDGFNFGSGGANADVALGLLHMFATGTGSGFGGGGGSAGGSFADELTFSSATLNGQPGYFYMTFTVRGTLSTRETGPYGGNGSASFHATLLADSPSAAYSDQANASGSFDNFSGYSGDPLPVLLQLTVPFVFGDPFSIGFSMDAGASGSGNGAGPPSGGAATADFLDTAFWGGVSEVFTAAGLPVTDFLLTSESGVDYRPSFDDAAAVAAPEPGFVFGFGGIAFAALRWARRRPR